jgi:hydrogenase-4 component F
MTGMLPLWTLLVPVATGAICYAAKGTRLIERVHLLGSTVTSALALGLVWRVSREGTLTALEQFFLVDALGAVVLAIIALVGWTASLFSIGYIRHELQEGTLDARQVKQYYFWYHVFLATMLAVCMVNNMGLLWVAIEATTIVSAFLVALYRKGEALEAAWKYLILCGTGIAIALLGVILLYASAVRTLGDTHDVHELLDWSFLNNPDIQLQPGVVGLAFVFLLVGLGTKVGFAPMHFWLPDAHSQAPTPVSALLSGVLLNCAMLVLIRFAVVAGHTIGLDEIRPLFIGAGLLSILFAFPFILVQQDLKRMLAFSTVEHMGIIAVAVGIGGAAGYAAALLQMFNHAMAKSLLFMAAGNLTQKYGTKQMARVTGALRILPFTGPVTLVGVLAISGLPPFSLFTSEFSVAAAGFAGGRPWVVAFMLAGIALIFGAMLFHASRMMFGAAREKPAAGELSRWSTWPLLLPLAFVAVFGLYVPPAVSGLIRQAAAIMTGGWAS